MLRTTKVAKAGGPEDGELSMSAQHHLALATNRIAI